MRTEARAEVSVQVIRSTKVSTRTAGRRLAEVLSAADEGIDQGEGGSRRGASFPSTVSGCDPEPWWHVDDKGLEDPPLGGLGFRRVKLRDW